MAVLGISGTLLGFIYPIANAFVLMILALPLVALIVFEVMGYVLHLMITLNC
jgi:hypothetical protein